MTRPSLEALHGEPDNLQSVSKSPGKPEKSALASMIAIACLALAACSGGETEPPAPETRSTTVTSPPDASTMTPLHAGNKEGQYGAALPSVSDGSVTARVPRGAPPAARYRSEVYWEDPSGQEIRIYEGDRLRCRLTLLPKLGNGAEDSSQWQLVWQLHGPQADGDWPQPPLNLHVRGGTWRVGGGAGRDGDEGGAEAYYEPFTPYVDGKTVTWTFDITVSADPARGMVDAWLDGEHVVRGWHPPSGTRYPGHDYLTVKAGLYAGADGTRERQTRTREVIVSSMRCSVDGTP